MRTIVVLGAADGALSTYRIAAGLGYRTVAVDRSATAPGVAVADEYLPISTRDTEAILAALAGRTDLAGVLAPCSDIAVPTLRALTVAFGLPFHLSDLAARASRDKWVLRGILDDLGVSSYRWIMGEDEADLVSRAARFGGPVVVKPADAQGGRGVTRCASPADLPAAVAEAARRSYGGTVMVEEEIAGIHCNSECVVDGGRVVFAATTRQTMSPPPGAITWARYMPAGLPAGIEATTRSIVDKVVARLDYRRGPLNVDFIVTPDGEPYLIEIGLRTGGNGTDDMVDRCFGVNPVRAAVLAATGEPVDLAPHPPQPVSWHVLAAERAGELLSVSGEAAARAMPEVVELVVLAGPGQRVRPYEEVSDRLGWFVLRADSPAALDAAAARVAATVRFDIAGPEPHRAGR